MSGWIKLHRKLTEWEWYSDVNTSRVFLHLLLVANHKDKKWRGIDIKRGQRLTSLSKLAEETNLSVKNVRTAIKRLKSTSEVASYSNAQHTVFTIVNYESYQSVASEVASEGQANGKQGATNKNVKNENNEKEDSSSRLNYQLIMDTFNEKMPHKKIKKMTDKRKALVKKAMDKSGADIEVMLAFIDHISRSPEWRWTREPNVASNGVNYGARPFDFYMTEDNLIKAMEE